MFFGIAAGANFFKRKRTVCVDLTGLTQGRWMAPYPDAFTDFLRKDVKIDLAKVESVSIHPLAPYCLVKLKNDEYFEETLARVKDGLLWTGKGMVSGFRCDDVFTEVKILGVSPETSKDEVQAYMQVFGEIIGAIRIGRVKGTNIPDGTYYMRMILTESIPSMVPHSEDGEMWVVRHEGQDLTCFKCFGTGHMSKDCEDQPNHFGKECRLAAKNWKERLLKEAQEKRAENIRLAAEQAENDRLADEQAGRAQDEQDDLIAVQAERDRLAAEQVEQENLDNGHDKDDTVVVTETEADSVEDTEETDGASGEDSDSGSDVVVSDCEHLEIENQLQKKKTRRQAKKERRKKKRKGESLTAASKTLKIDEPLSGGSVQTDEKIVQETKTKTESDEENTDIEVIENGEVHAEKNEAIIEINVAVADMNKMKTWEELINHVKENLQLKIFGSVWKTRTGRDFNTIGLKILERDFSNWKMKTLDWESFCRQVSFSSVIYICSTIEPPTYLEL
eukprot:GFUD01044243.1.p1 GENE.GFUD01044243.1~~GFUD01044243.1.p1  ORF type:complete len:505 (+),score=130.49 GFUD01044243.1:119-1633(+)